MYQGRTIFVYPQASKLQSCWQADTGLAYRSVPGFAANSLEATLAHEGKHIKENPFLSEASGRQLINRYGVDWLSGPGNTQIACLRGKESPDLPAGQWDSLYKAVEINKGNLYTCSVNINPDGAPLLDVKSEGADASVLYQRLNLDGSAYIDPNTGQPIFLSRDQVIEHLAIIPSSPYLTQEHACTEAGTDLVLGGKNRDYLFLKTDVYQAAVEDDQAQNGPNYIRAWNGELVSKIDLSKEGQEKLQRVIKEINDREAELGRQRSGRSKQLASSVSKPEESIVKQQDANSERTLPPLNQDVPEVEIRMASKAFTNRMIEAYKSFPEYAREDVRRTGYKIIFGHHLTQKDLFPELEGKHPSGWPDGATFANVEGMEDDEKKWAVVAEFTMNGSSLINNPHPESILRHEFSHALDVSWGTNGKRFCDSKEFIDAYNADIAAIASLGLNPKDRSRLNYHLQTELDKEGRLVGRIETCGDMIALCLGGSMNEDDRATLIKAFPKVQTLITNKLEKRQKEFNEGNYNNKIVVDKEKVANPATNKITGPDVKPVVLKGHKPLSPADAQLPTRSAPGTTPPALLFPFDAQPPVLAKLKPLIPRNASPLSSPEFTSPVETTSVPMELVGQQPKYADPYGEQYDHMEVFPNDGNAVAYWNEKFDGAIAGFTHYSNVVLQPGSQPVTVDLHWAATEPPEKMAFPQKGYHLYAEIVTANSATNETTQTRTSYTAEPGQHPNVNLDNIFGTRVFDKDNSLLSETRGRAHTDTTTAHFYLETKLTPTSYQLPNYFLPVPYQRDAGSCLQGASTVLLEYLLNQDRRKLNPSLGGPTDLSEQYAMYLSKRFPLPNPFTDAVERFCRDGYVEDRHLPFVSWERPVSIGEGYIHHDLPKIEKNILFSSGTKPIEQQPVGLMNYYDLKKIKEYLSSQESPVLFVYRPPAWIYHAAVITGFDDPKKVFTVRDSLYGKEVDGPLYTYGGTLPAGQGFKYRGETTISYGQALRYGLHATGYRLTAKKTKQATAAGRSDS